MTSVMLTGLLVAAGPALAATEVIATGLDNPRGIAFAPDGRLYVAEAGHGGLGNCTLNGAGENVCYGENGALARIDLAGAGATRVVTGLPSLAGPSGFGASGPNDLSFLGSGNAQLVMGYGAEPAARAALGPKAALLGTLLQVSRGSQYKVVADIAAHEAAENPDGGVYPPGHPSAGEPKTDSNPYGVLALPSRRLVVDAGGNALLEAFANGSTRTLAVFGRRFVPSPFAPPPAVFPMEAVPTTVTMGPDGWLYVGQLTGFPFPTGAAQIYRIPPEGGTPEVFLGGFTNIIDLDFDADGNLYVLEIAAGLGTPLSPPGRLLKVAPGGSRTVVAPGLLFPGGVAVAPDGNVYVTVRSTFPASAGGGQVLRISP